MKLILSYLHKTLRKAGGMCIKRHIEKAYDSLNFNFLESTLQKMGFDHNWVKLIMACVRSPTFSILFNGTPRRSFKPTRGLRRGDPISPYLFIICAEVVTAAINRAVNNKELDPLRISKNGPPVSHLIFADDTIIFAKANRRSCKTIRKIITGWPQRSGPESEPL